MSYPWSTAQIAAIGRLAEYNGNAYNATTNPKGMANGGHRVAFTPSLNDTSTAAGAIKDAADFAGAKADAAATSATAAGQAVSNLSGTSTTTLAIGAGEKTLTTQAGKSFQPGRTVRLVSAANPNTAYMVGKVKSYSGAALVVTVLLFVGSGEAADWSILVESEIGSAGTVEITGATSLAPDQPPTAVNSGTATAARIALGIPRGMPAGLFYKWSTNTVATDPGAGRVKVGSASLTTATALYLSETDANAVAQSAVIASWDDSTNPVRGQLRIEDIRDPANFVVYDVTGALTDNGSWNTLPVAYVDKGGTLTDAASVRLEYRGNGNKGLDGDPGNPGAAATIAIESTDTLAAGQPASFENIGTPTAARIKVGIPRGQQGPTGPVVATRYNFDTVTTDADPQNGNVRFNNAAAASVTLIYLDNVEASGGITMTGFIDTFDDSTNPSGKGTLTFKDVNDQSKFVIFVVTGAVVDGTGYRKVPVTWLSGAGGFTAGANLGMTFDRAGDKGADGGGAGNVVGPSTATDGGFALFSGTTGKLLQSGQAPGALAYKQSINNNDWSGAALTIGNGGTGAATVSVAQQNLNLVPGTHVLAYSGKIQGLADLTWAANKGLYLTSASAIATYDLTSYGRTLTAATDAAAAQMTLQLRPGVEVQAYHANLQALSALAGAANRLPYFTGAGAMALAPFGNVANGVPILDANGVLLASVLPALAISDTFVVASQSAMLALTAERGDVAVRTDLNKSYILKAEPASTLANWQELLTPTDLVQSVAGLQGVITAAQLQTALGLGSLAYLSSVATANIAGDAVTNAKLANMATGTFKGRATAGTGDPEDLSGAQATSLLNNFAADSGDNPGTKGLVPAPANGDAAAGKLLRADGTWAAPASGGGGKFVDSAYAEYTSTAALTTVVPYDGTIPQSDEGTQVLSVSITPKSTTNRLRAYFSAQFQAQGGVAGVVASIFRSGNANALNSTYTFGGNGDPQMQVMAVEWTPGSTTAVTVSVRVGPANSGTITLSGSLGGAPRAVLIVEEIVP